MYGICFEGPSGIDDGISEYIVKNGERYLAPAKDMLLKAQPGSREQDVAQYFMELSSLGAKSKP